MKLSGRFALSHFKGEVKAGDAWFEAEFTENANRPVMADIQVTESVLADAYSLMFILPGHEADERLRFTNGTEWVLMEYAYETAARGNILRLRYERDETVQPSRPQAPPTVVLRGLPGYPQD